jgi:hypothetical protein
MAVEDGMRIKLTKIERIVSNNPEVASDLYSKDFSPITENNFWRIAEELNGWTAKKKPLFYCPLSLAGLASSNHFGTLVGEANQRWFKANISPDSWVFEDKDIYIRVDKLNSKLLKLLKVTDKAIDNGFFVSVVEELKQKELEILKKDFPFLVDDILEGDFMSYILNKDDFFSYVLGKYDVKWTISEDEVYSDFEDVVFDSLTLEDFEEYVRKQDRRYLESKGQKSLF